VQLPATAAAAAVRGGRGSQPPGRWRRAAVHPGQRPPSAAAEDRNHDADSTTNSGQERQRPPSAAAEDRNGFGRAGRIRAFGAAAAVRGGRGSQLDERLLGCPAVVGSGRRPRRPRIATPQRWLACTTVGSAAAAVRGGRGSQRDQHRGVRPRVPQRPPSAAAEDRNDRGDPDGPTGQAQRPPSAAAEDRNGLVRGRFPQASLKQRPPSAAAEDRNLLHLPVLSAPPAGSGRRPRRPRIATSR